MPNIYNALTEKRRTCTVVCMMLEQFKRMSSCWSRTKIKQINIYIYILHGQKESYKSI